MSHSINFPGTKVKLTGLQFPVSSFLCFLKAGVTGFSPVLRHLFSFLWPSAMMESCGSPWAPTGEDALPWRQSKVWNSRTPPQESLCDTHLLVRVSKVRLKTHEHLLACKALNSYWLSPYFLVFLFPHWFILDPSRYWLFPLDCFLLVHIVNPTPLVPYIIKVPEDLGVL